MHSHQGRGTLNIVLLLQNLFQILFEETFSMLFNLSGCSCAEDFCNLHAIIAILLIFLQKYLVFVLHLSSFLYIIVWKTSSCIISCFERTRYRKQIAMTSDCYAKWPMECSSDKERSIKTGDNKH